MCLYHWWLEEHYNTSSFVFNLWIPVSGEWWENKSVALSASPVVPKLTSQRSTSPCPLRSGEPATRLQDCTAAGDARGWLHVPVSSAGVLGVGERLLPVFVAKSEVHFFGLYVWRQGEPCERLPDPPGPQHWKLEMASTPSHPQHDPGDCIAAIAPPRKHLQSSQLLVRVWEELC